MKWNLKNGDESGVPIQLLEKQDNKISRNLCLFLCLSVRAISDFQKKPTNHRYSKGNRL